MKNLINKLFVVLTVSALFAGSMEASKPSTLAERRMSKGSTAKGSTAKPVAVTAEPTKAQEALAKIMQYGPSKFEIYTEEQRKNNISVLRNALPKSTLVSILEKYTLEKDISKRNVAFGDNGEALKACVTLNLELCNNNLKNAVDNFENDPKAENAIIVKKQEEIAKNAINEADKVAEGWKKYMTARNALYASIGLAGVVITGYIAIKGVPAVLRPYLSPFTTRISTLSTSAYNKAAALGEAMGLGETGRIGSAARSFGRSVSNAGTSILAGIAATRVGKMLGLMAADAPKAPNTPDVIGFQEQQRIKAELDAAEQARIEELAREKYLDYQ